MRYLIDTNIVIYLLAAPNALSAEARRIVESEPDVSASIVSLWEIGIKQSIGKLSLRATIPEIENQCVGRGISILPISASAIERVKFLPDIHRDPFDRLLVAQAEEGRFAFVTSDTIIPQYPITTVW